MQSTHDEVDLKLLVSRKETLAEGVVRLHLTDPGGAALPSWTPGSHIDLQFGEGLVRQYSLCGDPDDTGTWQVAILREPDSRGGSAFAHEHLTEGTQIGVRGPRNHFELAPAANYLFIGGGIGITPLVPMIREAERAGANWRLLYGGRTRGSMAFRDELAALGDRVSIRPQDETGLLDLAAFLGEPRPDTAVYCCGPEPLLQAVEQACERWPSGTLHVERFAPKEMSEPVRKDSFEVELAQSGQVLTVPPERSILEVLEDAGLDVPSSCQEGTCGTCETVVLGGEPDHRDSLLTPEEQEANETMMICVSRAKCARLVLDL
ncbi:PDR/VanB family oxidoreductase [Amycolatopsis methanolica]|uniref:PDR/VanB family oxidoreductase n=1 Tax=Amycolatopsis methanolica TaxID=1814 RepID=UPI003412EA10